jgi:hypothetical protein
VAQTIENHYDNLQVLRTAPLEVIKASYRALSQKYHPDRNPDPAALRDMQLINRAWDVLSDPERRATHDRLLASAEQLRGAAPSAGTPAAAQPEVSLRPYLWRLGGIAALVLVVLLVAVQLFKAFTSADAASPPDVPVANASAPTEDDAVVVAGGRATPGVRPTSGFLWSQGYHVPGPVSFEIDNSLGQHDVEAKLIPTGADPQRLFVRKGERFEADGLPYGTYTVQYKVLVDGKPHVWQARRTFAMVQTAQEARESRYNKYNKSRVSTFDVAAGKANADEIASDGF